MPAARTTVVTGGGRGIGAAIALRLATDGHDLAVGYRANPGAAGRVVEAAMGLGRRAVAVQVDVRDEKQVERLFAVAGEQLGPVTGLVNNAGLTARLDRLADTPVADIRRVIEVNLTGAVLCAREAARAMSGQAGRGSGGVIINVSSAAATLGSPGEYVHYAAAKAGVDTLTMGLAKELAADGVRVNAVAPGVVATSIHADAGDADRPQRLTERIPLRRPGLVDEVAAAVAWLMSEEASYVTGAVLRVAGGL